MRLKNVPTAAELGLTEVWSGARNNHAAAACENKPMLRHLLLWLAAITTACGDINDAVVFTMNELTDSQYGLDLARQAGSEVLIRGWFKWHQAPRLESLRWIPEKAHAFGALFGGGITCSALYDGENGLTREQLLDMATRGADGKLVDAWNHPDIRHGSLSSPAYLDYLFRWCREQIDAGVDYLFMDELTPRSVTKKATMSTRALISNVTCRCWARPTTPTASCGASFGAGATTAHGKH
jgi:hypothetical protein